MTATLNSAQVILANAMSEGDLQASVIESLDTFRWLWFHDYDATRNNAGLPDLVAVRGGRLLFIELKSNRGRLRVEQRSWLGALGRVDGIEVYLWTPRDWHAGTIEEVLK